MKKKKSADFRYNTGEAKVPWAAVGEYIRKEDLDNLEHIYKLLKRHVGDKVELVWDEDA